MGLVKLKQRKYEVQKVNVRERFVSRSTSKRTPKKD